MPRQLKICSVVHVFLRPISCLEARTFQREWADMNEHWDLFLRKKAPRMQDWYEAVDPEYIDDWATQRILLGKRSNNYAEIRGYTKHGHAKGFHGGTDLGELEGTLVPTRGGHSWTEYNDSMGLTVYTKMQNGDLMQYAHLSKSRVPFGYEQRIHTPTSMVIGRVGQTSAATGPHLHYGIYSSMLNQFVSPYHYLKLGSDPWARSRNLYR